MLSTKSCSDVLLDGWNPPQIGTKLPSNGGRRIKLVQAGTHQIIAVDEIELDRSNPRIRKFLEMYGDNPSPEAIYLALGPGSEEEPGSSSSTTFEKLKQSILTNGGIIQPVILNRRADGTLVCVEGNTRPSIKASWTKASKATGPISPRSYMMRLTTVPFTPLGFRFISLEPDLGILIRKQSISTN